MLYIHQAGLVYAQNFDSLPDPGATSVDSGNPVTIDTTNYSLANPYAFAAPVAASGSVGGLGITALAGWHGTSDLLSRFGASDGDQTAGGQISFGSPSSSNRALGLLATSTTAGTAFGVKFVNDTATTLNQMNLQFTGEVWRQSNKSKTLRFYYFIDLTGTNAFPGRDCVYPGTKCEFPDGGGRQRWGGDEWDTGHQPDQFECAEPGDHELAARDRIMAGVADD